MKSFVVFRLVVFGRWLILINLCERSGSYLLLDSTTHTYILKNLSSHYKFYLKSVEYNVIVIITHQDKEIYL